MNTPQKIKILVVNDNLLPRRLTCRFLENAGFNTSQAGNGIEALIALTDESFDLIITNYNMQKMNGLELTDFIYKHLNPKPLVIFETFAWTHDIDAVAIEAGADECYNHNGIDEKGLLDVVFRLLRRKGVIA